MIGSSDGDDPRRTNAMPLTEDPVVARAGRGLSTIAIVGVFAVLAVALFLFLNARRTEQAASLVTPVSEGTLAAQPPAPPLQVAAAPPPVVAQTVAAPPPAPIALPPPPAPVADVNPNLRSPAVVVDLQAGAPAPAPASGAANPGQAKPVTSGAVDAASALLAGSGGSFGVNQQFAAQTSDALPESAVATQMTHLTATITQGATIPAVLETALNSDLPGYTRAVVSRDVRSFDGKAVLIPRGSRLIGQYRSALSQGQSRVFVIWTRVIRPDGVSVQIGSPGEDALGRGGLTGEVDSHFFARFGGAVLLSVLNTGLAAVAGTPSTQVVIGSPSAAVGAAASATVPTGENIVPTIKVDQGAAITIFVARDLDFSIVKPVGNER
jgi:type IV secretory pathway VirB10-like protein